MARLSSPFILLVISALAVLNCGCAARVVPRSGRYTAILASPAFPEEGTSGEAGTHKHCRTTKATFLAGERVISPRPHEQLRYAPLDEELFPNGKIWWSYPWLADKKRAFLVHTNWNKQQKKSRLADCKPLRPMLL